MRSHGTTCGSGGAPSGAAPRCQRGPEVEGQPPVAGPDLVHSEGTATGVCRRARRRQPAAGHAPGRRRGFSSRNSSSFLMSGLWSEHSSFKRMPCCRLSDSAKHQMCALRNFPSLPDSHSFLQDSVRQWRCDDAQHVILPFFHTSHDRNIRLPSTQGSMLHTFIICKRKKSLQVTS